MTTVSVNSTARPPKTDTDTTDADALWLLIVPTAAKQRAQW